MDGCAQFDGASVTSVQAVNFFNRDKTLDLTGDKKLSWQSVTTGNCAGFIATLERSQEGSIQMSTPLINDTIPLAEIG